MQVDPSPETKAQAAAILGWTPDTWRGVSRGYTPAARYVVAKDDKSAFLKVATTPLTARMITREIEAYLKINAPFLPRLYGYDAVGQMPLLAIEDLSAAIWPPPWTLDLVTTVAREIDAMHATRPDLRHGGLLEGRVAGCRPSRTTLRSSSH